MSNNDEFENLIKSFKLDDVEGETPLQQPAPTKQRQVFNFEEDERRYAEARRDHQVRREQQARQGIATKSRPATPARAANPSPNSMQEKQENKKRSFQVNIKDEAFFEPSAPVPQPSYGGGGGGRHGDGGRGGGDGGKGSGAAGRWAKALIVLVIVLAVSVFLAFFALESASDMFGLNKENSPVTFELPEGLSMSEIASLLKKEGVIKQPLTFQIYAGLKNDVEDFIPGSYALNSNMSYDQIMITFRSGTKREEVKITFIEGMTLSQIADLLEENRVCTKDELFAFLKKGNFSWNFDFLENVPDDETRFQRFEGYFFPDTYDFYVGEDPEVVTLRFFRRFNEMVNTDEMKEKMAAMDMTLDETLILASIIQKEAGAETDMKNVSGVFHNRLAHPDVLPKLQSDVTKIYVNDNIKPYIDQTQSQEALQTVYDAYNTYVCNGLPVGPISNPGMDAIMAALEPNESNYYYFVTDMEGTFYYAATKEEHDQNVAAALPKGEVHGTDTEGAGES